MKLNHTTGAVLCSAALCLFSGCAPKISPALESLQMETLRADEKSLELKNETIKLQFFPGKAGILCSGVPVLLPEAVTRTEKDCYELSSDTVRRYLMPLAHPAKAKVRRILIDPGHGGKDTGAIGVAKTRECDLNLSLAKELKKALESCGFTVIMTRDRDAFIPLGDRAKKTQTGEADLFISVHHNAAANPNASGFECYALKIDQDAEEKAASPSVRLAWLIQKEQCGVSGNYGRGVRFARFKVLCTAQTPAVLIEAGFLSCKAEEAKLCSAQYQQLLAQAIARAVKAFAAL